MYNCLADFVGDTPIICPIYHLYIIRAWQVHVQVLQPMLRSTNAQPKKPKYGLTLL